MSNATAGNKPALQNTAPPAKSGGISMQTVVIAILVLAAVALLAYQFIGCGSCYAKPSI